MKKSISFIGIIILLLSFSFMSAQSPRQTPRCFWINYTSRLNLTPKQQTKFEDLYKKFIKDISSIQNQINSQYLELRSLYQKSPSDNTTIINKQRKISALQYTYREKILDYRLDAMGVLTTEQILLLPSDCCLGINLRRNYGMGFGRGYGFGYGKGRGRGYGRRNGLGYGRGRRGMGNRVGFCPYWWR